MYSNLVLVLLDGVQFIVFRRFYLTHTCVHIPVYCCLFYVLCTIGVHVTQMTINA